MNDVVEFNEDECEEFEPLADDLLLSEMIRAIVSYPEKVEIEEYCDATKPNPVKILIVRVDPKDCGKVIGKQGRMAELLRSFMTTVGMHHGYSMTVMIEGSKPPRENHRQNHRRRDPEIEYMR